MSIYIRKQSTDGNVQDTLNAFAVLPKVQKAAIRQRIIELLSLHDGPLFQDETLKRMAFHELTKVQMHRPMDIPEFTDFSNFEEHCRNVSGMLNHVRDSAPSKTFPSLGLCIEWDSNPGAFLSQSFGIQREDELPHPKRRRPATPKGRVQERIRCSRIPTMFQTRL